MKKLIYWGENKILSIIIRTKGQHNIHLQEWKTGGRNKNLEHILILGRISLAHLSGFVLLCQIYII